MKKISWLGSIAVLVLAGSASKAQERDNKGINPLSVHEINDADIMMKKTIWRRLDLKEKVNQPLFSTDNEITKYIIEAMRAGLLDAYDDDKLAKKLTLDQFNKKMMIPATTKTLTEEEIKAGFSDAPTQDAGWGDTKKDPKKPDAAKPADDGWGGTQKKTAATDDGWGATPKKGAKNAKGKKGAKTGIAAAPKTAIDSTEIKRKMAEDMAKASEDAATKALENQWFPAQLSVIELKEDWIVDRKRSRQYTDIQTLTIYVPSDINPTGLETPVATFKFKDLDKLFRSDPKKFIWFNEYNQAQHKNLADAFDLRLFSGRVTKMSNPKNQDLISIYGGEKAALWKSVQLENELMELEHGLWEY